MSGFLRRLAAQAMGVANPVRSAASSPFAGAPALVEESLPLAAGAAPVVRASGRCVVLGATAPDTSDSSTGQLGSRRDFHADSAFGLKAEQPQGGSQGSAATARAEATERSINDAPKIEPAPLLSAGREASALSLLAPERDTHVAAEKAGEPESGVPAPSGHPSIEIGPTELLLPSPARPVVARGVFERERQWPQQPQRRPNRNGVGTVDETTEVHVNIGRIEVTALHEASPPKRPTPRRPAPMSLDDYVARRQGNRS